MKMTLLASAIMATSIFTLEAQAADVPAGVELAAKQELVRGGGAEPATLDPQKMEGTPASIRSKDLLKVYTTKMVTVTKYQVSQKAMT